MEIDGIKYKKIIFEELPQHAICYSYYGFYDDNGKDMFLWHQRDINNGTNIELGKFYKSGDYLVLLKEFGTFELDYNTSTNLYGYKIPVLVIENVKVLLSTSIAIGVKS